MVMRRAVLIGITAVGLCGAAAIGQPGPPPAPTMVFFDWGKPEVNGDAAGILDAVAAQFRANPAQRILLAGHSDRSGPERTNLRSSQRRADAVRAYMVGHGVPDGAISTTAFGELKPLVPTEDGVREPQNRRVEITFGPAPAR